jgi:DNA-binding transcriptional LysR family regulator
LTPHNLGNGDECLAYVKKSGTSSMEQKIDLNSLVLFHEVIEAGSLTAASAKLKLAKSTISRRLSRLEQQFGSILIKKGLRKLVLTEVGASLHKGCEQIVADVRQATRQALSVHSDLQGTVRVSIPGDFGITWLGTVVADFVRQFPEISVEIRVYTADIVDPVKEPFDIAIQIGEKRPLAPVCKRIATLPRGVYASPGYLAARGIPRSFEDCKAHDWIVTDVQLRDGILLFQKRKRGKAIDVSGRIIANSARLARELATAGLGLAMIPDALCEQRLQQGRLVRILPEWQCPALQVVALFLSRDRIPRKTREFLDFFAKRISVNAKGSSNSVTPAALR